MKTDQVGHSTRYAIELTIRSIKISCPISSAERVMSLTPHLNSTLTQRSEHRDSGDPMELIFLLILAWLWSELSKPASSGGSPHDKLDHEPKPKLERYTYGQRSADEALERRARTRAR